MKGGREELRKGVMEVGRKGRRVEGMKGKGGRRNERNGSWDNVLEDRDEITRVCNNNERE